MTSDLKKLTPEDIAQYIDHTLLKPEATRAQIQKLCEEALVHKFYAVCVNSSMISVCKEILKNSAVKIAAVIGFPLGACDTSTKVFETTRALNLGATEIDMVVHLGAVKSQDWSYVEKDIKDVVMAAQGHPVKVILETHMLTEEEKRKVCEISLHAGAHFVKTSTGFSGGGATVEDVTLMKSIVQSKAQVKASGGVRDFDAAVKMITAGATRIGTSSGVAIVTGQAGKTGY
ncbi:deoxyribose-phosphate aldolase [Pseudobdellovibrio sp. HCB154]|uniref:deoxyribose-phosphate aldolase n=1 Tax=Pseudobdellovibrio sp. HCB154 TaxID=3386277 RepID=UPI0039171954